jgi:hypothetical protein
LEGLPKLEVVEILKRRRLEEKKITNAVAAWEEELKKMKRTQVPRSARKGAWDFVYSAADARQLK